MVLKKTRCLICNTEKRPLFNIPKNPARQKTWLKRLQLQHLSMEHDAVYINNNGRLCSLHFDDTAFTSTLKTRLLKYALPVDLQPPSLSSPSQSSSVIPVDIQPPSLSSPSQSSSVVQTPLVDSTIFSTANLDEQIDETVRTPVDIEARPSIRTPKTREISRLRCKVSKLKKKLFKSSKTSLLAELSDLLTASQYDFVLSQIRFGKLAAKGRRWTPKDKAFALSIHHQSPAAYRLLKKYFALPCVNTLKKSVGHVAEDDGCCPILMKSLSEKAKRMTENEKLCTLVLDEMSIKSRLSYNAALDLVDGYESSRMNDENPQIATQAMVFMLRGIAKNWKQVFAYYFRGNKSTEEWLKKTLLDVMDNVESCGLKVMAIVCDQGPKNQQLMRLLDVSENKAYFMYRERKVYALYDMPHLLKSVRNNFRKYSIKFSDIDDKHTMNVDKAKQKKTASWKDIVKLYEWDQARKYSLAPKLKKEHIYGTGMSNMNVRLAAQIFSHSVSSGLETLISLGQLNSSAIYTADFVAALDVLFDSMNSKSSWSSDIKPLAKAVSKTTGHVKYWKKCIKWIKTWSFIGSSGNVVKPACKRGLIMTLKATIGIWEDIKASVDYFMTNRLNQDCLENSFSSVRKQGGFKDNPSAQEFRTAIRNVIVHNFTKQSVNKNCEDDSDFSLVLLGEKSPSKLVRVIEDIVDDVNDNELVIDLKKDEVPTTTDIEENVIGYISGVLSRKVLKKKPCEKCKELLVGDKLLDQRKFFLYFKDYSESIDGLKWPTDAFFDYMLKLNDCYFGHLRNYFLKRGVRSNLCAILENVPFNFYNDHEHEIEVKKLMVHAFVTMMIKHQIRKKNEEHCKVDFTKQLKHVQHL